jgi:hypothetical protein
LLHSIFFFFLEILGGKISQKLSSAIVAAAATATVAVYDTGNGLTHAADVGNTFVTVAEAQKIDYTYAQVELKKSVALLEYKHVISPFSRVHNLIDPVGCAHLQELASKK